MEVQNVMTAPTQRVKGIDMHPTEPLMLCALYNGQVLLINYESKVTLHTYDVSELPVRCVKFISSLHSFACGSDEMNVHIHNFKTNRKVKILAHEDYIRCLVVHEQRSLLLTCGDDMTIKLWDWTRGWRHAKTFRGHEHYVMCVAVNSKDPTMFASASLDATVKVWSTTSPDPVGTLQHEKGVNCVDVCHSGESESTYLISGSEDHKVRVWEYPSKACVHVLSSHHSNHVTCVVAHRSFPIMFSTGEDGAVAVYSTQTWRHEKTLTFGEQRCWALGADSHSNVVAAGFDQGFAVFRIVKGQPRCDPTTTTKALDGDDLEDACFPAAAEDAHLLHDPTGQYSIVITDTDYDATSWGQPPPCCTQRGPICWCGALLIAIVVLVLVVLLRKR
jgi:coatomer subunit beta'